ncbi:MAG TPA: DEAD/DEAH box helicase family protein [Thermoplasmata archaeon]|nr:DEAD/DEAH box helicase family protein [Thermoplasmata archaeon]
MSENHAAGEEVLAESDRRGLRALDLAPDYNTEDNDIVRELYAPCLERAERYDRAVGYFRANVYRELGEQLLNFAIGGGRARIVCSPDLPEPDEDAAREGYELRGTRSGPDLDASLAESLLAMSRTPDEADCLNMLRLLIEKGSLDLFVAVRSGGIYHRKLGTFSDSYGDMVVFCGSGNETERAVSAIEDWSNDEEFDVFRSWGGEFERAKALRKASYLQRLLSCGTQHTKVRPLNEVERSVMARFRSYQSFEDCRPGARKRSGVQRGKAPIVPYAYQMDAVRAWANSGSIGVLSMATGTGKTVTALLALRPHIDAGNPVVVVVPTRILFEQWLEELQNFYQGVPVLLAGAGHDWKSDQTKRLYVSELRLPRIILATMRTAATDDFMEFLGQAKDPILVADEVHRLGSPIYRRLLQIPFKAKLGLSATPERLFDIEGMEALSKAFGTQPVFRLELGDRVRLSDSNRIEVPIIGHFLAPYEYDFECVELTAAEQEEWDDVTAQVQLQIARDPSLVRNGLVHSGNEKLKLLLIRRARIVKKAAAKIDTARRIVSARYPPNGRWIVYCDDEEQMNLVVDSLRSRTEHLTVLKYHSKMPPIERQMALTHFESNPGVIVSIRCLDEGVDIPSADGGLILASSTNPREYVQRRGRLLRKAIGKKSARIFDVLVLPKPASEEGEFPMSIVRNELARAYKFAQHAQNVEVTHRLWKVCQAYGVSLEKDSEQGLEEDDEEG